VTGVQTCALPILEHEDLTPYNGAFMGVVYNRKLKKFQSVFLQLPEELLVKIEHKILGTHDTVFGGIVEMNKYISKYITAKNVKTGK
jgi:hypothetical protein